MQISKTILVLILAGLTEHIVMGTQPAAVMTSSRGAPLVNTTLGLLLPERVNASDLATRQVPSQRYGTHNSGYHAL